MTATLQAQSLPETIAPTTESAEGSEEQIRRRAYELYELRGREDGHDVEDWLQSESEMRERMKPTGIAA